MRQHRPCQAATQQSRLWRQRVGALGIWILSLLIGPAFAHSGHDEAPVKLEVGPASSQQVRGSAHSEIFEVVLVWQATEVKTKPAAAKPAQQSDTAHAEANLRTQGNLVIYLDDYATNQAIQGASIEVTASKVAGQAKEIAAGVYQFDMPMSEREAVTLVVQAGEQMDLLAVDLAKPQLVEPKAHAHGYFEDFPAYWPGWLTAVIGFGLLALVGLWQRKPFLAWVRGA